MSSKKNILFFIFILFYPLVSFSQIINNPDSLESNYKHSIQFYIVNEVIAGYNYNFSENSAIRFIVNATGLFKDQDADRVEHYERISDTVTSYEDRKVTTTNQFYEVKIQYLYYINLHKIVQLYFGGGPFINYGYSMEDYLTERYSSNSTERDKFYSKADNNNTNLGVSIVAGVECIVYHNINLFAEYEADINKG